MVSLYSQVREYVGSTPGGWMDLLSGTGVAPALWNVEWPKPSLTPAQPLRSGRLLAPKVLLEYL